MQSSFQYLGWFVAVIFHFQFTFQPGADGESHIRVGKLNMVDLAGSERQTKTGATVSIAATDR